MSLPVAFIGFGGVGQLFMRQLALRPNIRKPIVWTEEERKKGEARGMKAIESFHTYGAPPVSRRQGGACPTPAKTPR